MATTPDYTYDDSEESPKDRVRGLMGDVAGPPWLFSDGRIDSNLRRSGESAPEDPGAGDVQRELGVAIALLETKVVSTGQTRTIKQGSVTRTTKDAESGGYEAVLEALRRRLLYACGGGSPIAVVHPDYPDLDRRDGYPSYDPLEPFFDHDPDLREPLL